MIAQLAEFVLGHSVSENDEKSFTTYGAWYPEDDMHRSVRSITFAMKAWVMPLHRICDTVNPEAGDV